MIQQYTTVRSAGVAAQAVRKSRFIGFTASVADRREAEDFIGSVAAAHKQATHCVPAFRVGLQRLEEWYSDAGEPAGSAGQPVLRALQAQELLQTVLVVVRYFGGVKLGAAGLARAYGDIAARSIAAGGTAVMVLHHRVELSVPYDLWGKLQHFLAQSGANVADIEYGTTVQLLTDIPATAFEHLSEQIADATAGRVQLHRQQDLYLPTANPTLPSGPTHSEQKKAP